MAKILNILLTGYIGDAPKVSVVQRSFNQTIIDNWNAFKAAGLPVVPTLRVCSDETLLVTDIKEDGSETYGNGLIYTLADIFSERFRPNKMLEATFLELTTNPQTFSKIKEKVRV